MAAYIWGGIGVLSALGLFGLSMALAVQRMPGRSSTGFKAALGEIYFYVVFFPALLVLVFLPQIGGVYLGLLLAMLCLVEIPRRDVIRVRFSLGRLALCSMLLATTMGWSAHLIQTHGPNSRVRK